MRNSQCLKDAEWHGSHVLHVCILERGVVKRLLTCHFPGLACTSFCVMHAYNICTVPLGGV